MGSALQAHGGTDRFSMPGSCGFRPLGHGLSCEGRAPRGSALPRMSMRRSLFAARRLDRVRVRLAALWAVLLAPGQGQQGRQEWALAQAPPVAARLA